MSRGLVASVPLSLFVSSQRIDRTVIALSRIPFRGACTHYHAVRTFQQHPDVGGSRSSSSRASRHTATPRVQRAPALQVASKANRITPLGNTVPPFPPPTRSPVPPFLFSTPSPLSRRFPASSSSTSLRRFARSYPLSSGPCAAPSLSLKALYTHCAAVYTRCVHGTLKKKAAGSIRWQLFHI